MIDLLLHNLRALVQHPDDLRLTEIRGAQSVFLELDCHPSDVGIVIGKNGKTISALRTLLHAMKPEEDLKVTFEVLEPR